MCTQPSARSTMLNGSAIMLVAMMLVNVFNLPTTCDGCECWFQPHSVTSTPRHSAFARILHQSGVPTRLREVCGQKSF